LRLCRSLRDNRLHLECRQMHGPRCRFYRCPGSLVQAMRSTGREHSHEAEHCENMSKRPLPHQFKPGLLNRTTLAIMHSEMPLPKPTYGVTTSVAPKSPPTASTGDFGT